jgi:hypothetical protein
MSALDRLAHMLTAEVEWFNAHHWTRVLVGTKPPEENLALIQADIRSRLREEAEYTDGITPLPGSWAR